MNSFFLRFWSFKFSGQSSNISMNFVGNFMFTKEGVFLNRSTEEFANEVFTAKKTSSEFALKKFVLFFLIGFKDKINHRDPD